MRFGIVLIVAPFLIVAGAALGYALMPHDISSEIYRATTNPSSENVGNFIIFSGTIRAYDPATGLLEVDASDPYGGAPRPVVITVGGSTRVTAITVRDVSASPYPGEQVDARALIPGLPVSIVAARSLGGFTANVVGVLRPATL